MSLDNGFIGAKELNTTYNGNPTKWTWDPTTKTSIPETNPNYDPTQDPGSASYDPTNKRDLTALRSIVEYWTSEFNDKRYAPLSRLFRVDEIKPAYDTTKSYTPGMLVEHNNQTWVCTADTTGVWDPTKWEEIDLIDYFQQAFKAAYPGYEAVATETLSEEVSIIEANGDKSVGEKMGAIRNAIIRLSALIPSSSNFFGIPEYKSTLSYSRGDLVTHNAKLYRFIRNCPIGGLDWETAGLYLENIVVGNAVVDGHDSQDLIESMTRELTDSDDSIVEDQIYRYKDTLLESYKLYKATDDYTKASNKSWTEIISSVGSKLIAIRLEDIAYKESDNEVQYMTQAEYQALDPSVRDAQDIIITDASLYGTKIKMCDSVSEYESLATPGDSTLYLIPGRYSTVSVMTQAEYDSLTSAEKNDGSVRFIPSGTDSEATIREWITQAFADQFTILQNRLTALESAVGSPYTKATSLDARVTALEP